MMGSAEDATAHVRCEAVDAKAWPGLAPMGAAGYTHSPYSAQHVMIDDSTTEECAALCAILSRGASKNKPGGYLLPSSGAYRSGGYEARMRHNVCRHYISGICNRGSSCRFYHPGAKHRVVINRRAAPAAPRAITPLADLDHKQHCYAAQSQLCQLLYEQSFSAFSLYSPSGSPGISFASPPCGATVNVGGNDAGVPEPGMLMAALSLSSVDHMPSTVLAPNATVGVAAPRQIPPPLSVDHDLTVKVGFSHHHAGGTQDVDVSPVAAKRATLQLSPARTHSTAEPPAEATGLSVDASGTQHESTENSPTCPKPVEVCVRDWSDDECASGLAREHSWPACGMSRVTFKNGAYLVRNDPYSPL